MFSFHQTSQDQFIFFSNENTSPPQTDISTALNQKFKKASSFEILYYLSYSKNNL